MKKPPAVRRFGRNLKGRDFVVSDIHGAYDLVLEAMRKVSFDGKVDRLFVGGDLVDRGKGSHRCLRFLRQNYIHAVMGNHEAAFVDLYENERPSEEFLRYVCQFNGMGWWLKESEESRDAILHEFRNLSLAMEIDTPRGNVGVVHGEVPRGMDWETFLTRLEAGDPSTVKACLSGRRRIKEDDHSGVEGVGRLYVGHTPQWEGIAKRGNVVAIDSGAAYGEAGSVKEGHLTLANIALQTQMLTGKRQNPNGIVEIKDADWISDLPFGFSVI